VAVFYGIDENRVVGYIRLFFLPLRVDPLSSAPYIGQSHILYHAPVFTGRNMVVNMTRKSLEARRSHSEITSSAVK